MPLLYLTRHQIHKPKIIESYLASDTPLNLNVRDSDTLRVYPDLFMRKSQKHSSYWTLRIIWRIVSVLQYQAMPNNKEDDQIYAPFLMVNGAFWRKAFPPSRGDHLQPPSQNDLSYLKRTVTHILLLLCALMPACVSPWISSMGTNRVFKQNSKQLISSPWLWGLSLERASSRLTATENANGTVLNPSPIGPFQLSGTPFLYMADGNYISLVKFIVIIKV